MGVHGLRFYVFVGALAHFYSIFIILSFYAHPASLFKEIKTANSFTDFSWFSFAFGRSLFEFLDFLPKRLRI